MGSCCGCLAISLPFVCICLHFVGKFVCPFWSLLHAQEGTGREREPSVRPPCAARTNLTPPAVPRADAKQPKAKTTHTNHPKPPQNPSKTPPKPTQNNQNPSVPVCPLFPAALNAKIKLTNQTTPPPDPNRKRPTTHDFLREMTVRTLPPDPAGGIGDKNKTKTRPKTQLAWGALLSALSSTTTTPMQPQGGFKNLAAWH